MICKHKKLRFGCKSCRSKVQTFENELEFRMDQLGRIIETLCRVYEEFEFPDKTADEIDDAIDQLKIIRYEVCCEAKIDQAQRCFFNLFRDFACTSNAIGGYIKSSKL